MLESLPPYNEYPQCPKCGSTRGRSEKLAIRWCHGAPREGMSRADACPMGAEEHMHVQCLFCAYEHGMNTADASADGPTAPLTAGDIRDLRELLRQARG